MTTHAESLYASSDPHATLADALAQLKQRLDVVMAESIANVQRRWGPNTLWSMQACGHAVSLALLDDAPGYVASAVTLIIFTESGS